MNVFVAVDILVVKDDGPTPPVDFDYGPRFNGAIYWWCFVITL